MEQPKQRAKRTSVEKETITVRTVYGPMVNLITGQRIDGETQLEAIDGWTQSQIDAGKLELVK